MRKWGGRVWAGGFAGIAAMVLAAPSNNAAPVAQYGVVTGAGKASY